MDCLVNSKKSGSLFDVLYLSTLCVLSACCYQCEYEDSIEFQGKDGSFSVSLRATIPCYALEMPDSVLLPLCAVQNSTQASFLLRNVRYKTLMGLTEKQESFKEKAAECDGLL